MKQIQWTKMSVDYMTDPRLLAMLGQKIGIEALAILIFLWQFAAKINKHGYVYLTEKSL